MDKSAISTELEKLEGDSVKLTVTVSAADVDSRISQAYREASKKYRFPGFRPGHAPKDVIDHSLGKDAVRAQATESLLNDTYLYAVDSNSIKPVGEPKVDASEIVNEGEDYVYTITVETEPTFELSSYEPVEIEPVIGEATPEDIEAQLAVLRSYQYDFQEIAPREVKEDDYLILNMEAKDKTGEKVDKYSGEERIWQIGNGILPKAFDDEIIGMKPGDEPKEFRLTASDGIQDGPIDFKVSVVKIREKVFSELDDEFAVKCGAENLEDLKTKISEGITEEKSKNLDQTKESRCTEALISRIVGEIPDSMINMNRQQILQNFFQQLQANNITFDMYLSQMGISAPDFQKDLDEQAKEYAQQSVALDAIARHQDLTVSDEELDEEFIKGNEDDEAAAKKMRESWEQRGLMTDIREAILRSKAMKWVIDTAVETATPASADEKPAKKSAKKEDTAEESDAKAPAKKAPAKKTAAKKAEPSKEAAEKKPAAAKKTAAKNEAPEGSPEDK